MLTNQVNEKTEALRDLKAKLQIDPGYHTLEFVEEKLENHLEKMKNCIVETILKNKEDANKEIQENIKTYASVAAPNVNQQPQPDNIDDIRQVVKTVRQAERAEEREIKLRSKNIIIHGAPDTQDNQEDQSFVADFIEALHINVSIKQVVRIGQPSEGKKRPIKISFESEEEKFKLLRNLSTLRGMDQYQGISITEDLTKDQRNQYKALATEAKQKNQDSVNGEFVWRVRGSSKNGFRLKKLQKNNQQEPQI